MNNIKESLKETNLSQQFEKIKSFYDSELGIIMLRGDTKNTHDDLEETPITLHLTEVTKLKNKNINNISAPTQLNSDIRDSILHQYFTAILENASDTELTDLKSLLTASLSRIPLDLCTEDYQVQNYLTSLDTAITEQLLYAELQKSIDNNSSVATLSSALHKIQLLQKVIDPKIVKTLEAKTYAPLSTDETLDLLNLIEAKNFLETLDPKPKKLLDTIANATVMAIKSVLTQYRADILETKTDIHKARKLELIDAMLHNYEEDPLLHDIVLEAIKSQFTKDTEIHKTLPIGRYIYLCLCTLFHIKPTAPDYNIKLFDALTKVSGQEDNTTSKKPFIGNK